MHSTKTGTLQPKAPFDFECSLAFLGMFPPMHGEQQVVDRSLTKAVTIDGQPIVFNVRSTGTVVAPQMTYTLYADQPISASLERAAADRIRFFLSLDDDLRPFYAQGEQDACFAPVIRRWYGYHQVKFLTPFEHTCWAILGQRIPMNVAQTIKQSIAEHFGSPLEVEGVTYHAFPEAQQLLAAADRLPEVVHHGRKAEYLLAAALAFADVDEQWLRHAPADDVEAWLLNIKGIGAWSARFVMIRGLGHMDRLSIGEARFFEAARELYGHELSEDQIRAIGAGYGAYQGYWAYYLRSAE
ncbi:MAG: DNA-3-methyladenine glycosylase 2 family protein [Chloroflexi bacterium]|nr:DNA-3-methyladenine glycosylase 2 family protein [Chloroflexota bacterium]